MLTPQSLDSLIGLLLRRPAHDALLRSRFSSKARVRLTFRDWGREADEVLVRPSPEVP